MENKHQPINPTTYSKSGDGPNDYDPLIPNKKTGWERQFGGLTKLEYASIEAMKGFIIKNRFNFLRCRIYSTFFNNNSDRTFKQA